MAPERRETDVAGTRVEWLEAAPKPGRAPTLYVHGVPTASWEWIPFMERTGGVAPTLPGFGRSPIGNGFDCSLAAYADFLAEFTDAIGLRRMNLVVHDFGAVGLVFAQRFPERIERVVVFNCTPLLPGYRWHRLARVWRTPLLGELFWALATKSFLARDVNGSKVTPGPMPREWIDRAWDGIDRRTKRAILRLYRSAPEVELERWGRGLGGVTCPTLILWADKDKYLPAEFGPAYADALGGEVTLEIVEGAGHWSWFDRPELIDRVAGFVAR